jgi:prophage antirepressor-like protein
MEIVKAFNENELHTEIVIKGTSVNPLFRASDVGNVLEISTIRSIIRDFNETEKVVHSMHTLGGLQEVTFLTEKGLYKVLFKSRKPIAEKFQNWVCDIIKEIRLHGIYDLQKQLEQQKDDMKVLEDKKKQEYEDKLVKQKILEREKILLKQYAVAGDIVYVIKVKTFENGHYIVKIGESRIGITNRYKEHKSKYPECLLLDCFSVNKSKDFESFLHNNEIIKESRVNDLSGHESELELFLIGKKLSYQKLLEIINNNLKYFNQNDTHKLELENEQLKLKLQMQTANSENVMGQELLNALKLLSARIEKLEKSNKEVLEKLNTSQKKLVTGFQQPLPTLGPRLQKINPETFELIKVYESVSELMKENSDMKRPSINKAVVENTIYHGFRWLLVDRELDANIIQQMQPTKQTIIKNPGYIAKLNDKKTTILNVYLDRKTAAQYNGYGSSSALDNPVKNLTLTKGHYYILYNDCDAILKDNFETTHGEPLLYKNGVGQFDQENNLVKEFSCKYDCIKCLAISDKTLAKALDKNILYQGCFYKSLSSKLHI